MSRDDQVVQNLADRSGGERDLLFGLSLGTLAEPSDKAENGELKGHGCHFDQETFEEDLHSLLSFRRRARCALWFEEYGTQMNRRFPAGFAKAKFR